MKPSRTQVEFYDRDGGDSEIIISWELDTDPTEPELVEHIQAVNVPDVETLWAVLHDVTDHVNPDKQKPTEAKPKPRFNPKPVQRS